MKVKSIATGLLAIAMVAVSGPAQAAGFENLQDAGGATNGCTLRLEPASFGASSSPGVENYQIASRYWFRCPASAGVLRVKGSSATDALNPDGTWTSLVPFSSGGVNRYVVPEDIRGSARINFPCWQLYDWGLQAGTETTVRVRYRVKTKTTQDNSDPNPFTATVSRTVSITC